MRQEMHLREGLIAERDGRYGHGSGSSESRWGGVAPRRRKRLLSDRLTVRPDSCNMLYCSVMRLRILLCRLKPYMLLRLFGR